jgi:diguanylate cyclase (GGDEF)-like protein/PAS domain S-box-containing protein
MVHAVETVVDLPLRGGIRGLLDAAADAMVVVGAQGEVCMVNSLAESLFGYSREELIGRPVEMLVPVRLSRRHAMHRSRFSAAPHSRSMSTGSEFAGQRKDGTEFPAEISLLVLETSDGTFVSSTIRDLTERKRLDREASHFQAVVESSHDAIIGKDMNGVITSWNAGAERLYGYSATEAIGDSVSMLVPPGRDDELPDILRRVRSGVQVDDFETVRTRKDGTQVDVSLTVSPIRDRNGTVVGASTIARDITHRRRYQDQLQFLADHDALTGACNRRRFEREVGEQVSRARRYGEQAALLVIDLDGFKTINDTYGHRVGDRALKTIVAALMGRLRSTDVVARVGGDEFAILLPYAGRDQGATVAASLRELIGGCTVAVAGQGMVGMSASIGVVQIDPDTVDEEAVLVEADRLMYRDKRRDAAPLAPPQHGQAPEPAPSLEPALDA